MTLLTVMSEKFDSFTFMPLRKKQGRKHGKTVADGWAGAENLENHKCDGCTDVPTDTASSRVAYPRLKTLYFNKRTDGRTV